MLLKDFLCLKIDGIPNVYLMPKPKKAEPDDTGDYRIPEPLPNTDAPLDINAVSNLINIDV